MDAALSPWGDPVLRARTGEGLAGVAGIVARYLRDGAVSVREAALPGITDRPAGVGGP